MKTRMTRMTRGPLALAAAVVCGLCCMYITSGCAEPAKFQILCSGASCGSSSDAGPTDAAPPSPADAAVPNPADAAPPKAKKKVPTLPKTPAVARDFGRDAANDKPLESQEILTPSTVDDRDAPVQRDE